MLDVLDLAPVARLTKDLKDDSELLSKDEVMKVAIVGSRDYKPLSEVTDFVNHLPDDTIVVSGGARGVDSTAEKAAKKRGLRTIIFPAEWDKYGKSAGFLRNRSIVTAADMVVVFWNGRSRGTMHAIKLAEEMYKPKIVQRSM